MTPPESSPLRRPLDPQVFYEVGATLPSSTIGEMVTSPKVLLSRLTSRLCRQNTRAAFRSETEARSSVNRQEKYQYQPLPQDHSIRLLRIIGYQQAPRRIQCSLVIHLLKDAPPYTALSYTWGVAVRQGHCYEDEENNQGKLQEIELEGNVHTVTENLFDALCEFGERRFEGYLWIDALCICQNNLEERATQVLLMGDIYSTAKEVVVWLGKDTTHLEEVIRLHEAVIITLGKKKEQGEIDKIWEWTSVHSPLDPGTALACGVPTAALWNDYWKAYFRFFRQRRWFYRAWIIQEVALARELVVWCGRSTVEWNVLWVLSWVLKVSGWQIQLHLEHGSLGRSIGDEVFRLGSLRKEITAGLDNNEIQHAARSIFGATTVEQRWYAYLAHLIQNFRRAWVSDDRDKIYSTLGLAYQFLQQGTMNPIQPNYDATVQEVYTSITSQLIQSLPILAILSLVEDKSRQKVNSLPSWVPDYTCPLMAKPFVWLGALEAGEMSKPPGGLFNASLATESSPLTHRIVNDTLILSGVLFDRVVEISTAETSLSAPLLLPLLELCCRLEETYPPTGQPRVEVLWRTMTSDFHDTHPAPQELASSFREFILLQMSEMMGLEVRRGGKTPSKRS